MIFPRYDLIAILLISALAYAASIPPSSPSPNFPSLLSHQSSNNPQTIPPACRDTCAPLAHLAGNCHTNSGACMRRYCQSNAIDVFVRCQNCKAKGSPEVLEEEEGQLVWLEQTYRASCAERLAEDKSGNAAASTLALTPNADYNASEAGIGAASESGASGRSSLLVSNMVVASVCFGLLMVIS